MIKTAKQIKMTQISFLKKGAPRYGIRPRQKKLLPTSMIYKIKPDNQFSTTEHEEITTMSVNMTLSPIQRVWCESARVVKRVARRNVLADRTFERHLTFGFCFKITREKTQSKLREKKR